MFQTHTSWVAGLVALASALLPAAAAHAGAETVLHSFQSNGADGYEPSGALIDVNGTLYGTTIEGGVNSDGTVFSIDPETGAENILYSFQGGADGVQPHDGLIDVHGTLYGTTLYGGVKSDGTVFKINPRGKEEVVYSFCGDSSGSCGDGVNPVAGLTSVGAILYGTTTFGGASAGTVFSVNRKSGAESVIYSFQRDGVDGTTPYAGLINVNGTLYGTTEGGGAAGQGTVFSVDPKTGAEKVVYAFCSQDGCADGSLPAYARLIDIKGTLYGTTTSGGVNNDGTVFRIDPGKGVEKLLYSFGGGTDGVQPYAALINVKGTLYGTTQSGGAYNGGTVFSVSKKSGAEKVVYSFCSQASCADGYGPVAGVIDVGGSLYGMTNGGGAHGAGTVFKVKLR